MTLCRGLLACPLQNLYLQPVVVFLPGRGEARKLPQHAARSDLRASSLALFHSILYLGLEEGSRKPRHRAANPKCHLQRP